MTTLDAGLTAAPDPAQGAGLAANREPGRIVLIGGGVMGETILAGLLKAGTPVERLQVVERNVQRAGNLASRYSVSVGHDCAAGVRIADTVLLIVKPQDAWATLDQIAMSLRPEAVLVSLCAGLTTAQLEAHLPAGTPVVRVMPNTPAKVGQGMAGISAGRHATGEHTERVAGLMATVGRTVIVPEKHQDALTALSGSGPAYLFYVVEAMIDAGVQLGLPRPIATELAVQTLLGSAHLLSESGTHPALLREAVTSPGGTTAAALRKLDEHGVRAAFFDAVEACARRSAELSQ